MPELEIEIGGRAFRVACQPGEEDFLRAAAAVLDAEAQPLTAQMGKLPEARLLLMAGLMLADRTAAIEDELRALRARAGEVARGHADASALAELAARAEALADLVEERAAAAGG